jgi:hypothetical protein
MHTSPSRALPEDGDIARISPKLCNVLLNPAQSHHLVLQAVVTGNYCVSSTQESWTANIVLASLSVGIATRIRAGRPRNCASIPDNGNSFFSSPQRPRRLCGTPTLLFHGKMGSLVREWKGRSMNLTSQLHLTPRSKVNLSMPLLRNITLRPARGLLYCIFTSIGLHFTLQTTVYLCESFVFVTRTLWWTDH